MYARVIRGRYNVGDEPKIRRAAEMLMLPEIRRAPGFRQYLGGFDDEARTFVAVTLWDTAEQARAVDGQTSPFGALVRFEPAHVFEISGDT